jgi:putative CRISPR-associated protein (TIGR02619 family)
MYNFVLSCCGTSLLNKVSSNEDLSLLKLHANTKSEGEINSNDLSRMESIIARASDMLNRAELVAVGALSAELNAILKFYQNRRPRKQDCHVLLCTDTWLGEKAALLVQGWLIQFGVNALLERRTDLQTRDLDSFRVALSELVGWCEENIPPYRQKNYKVIFNLTGGFKSINGFLQALAMIYADETIYVFESEDELLRLPRLPIQIDEEIAVRKELTVFRRLSNRLNVTDTSGIAETLLWEIEQKTSLSPWGELVWQRTRRSIYVEKLWPSPCEKIRFGEAFEKSLSGCEKDRLYLVNLRIDDLALHLESATGANRRRLDLKPLKGNLQWPSTHEIDAWSDGDAKRIFGHFDEQVFVLDRLNDALH